MPDEIQGDAVVVPEQSVTRLPALPQEMSIDQVEARVGKVRELQKRIMKDGVHYGVIPGTPKPTLLKGGAELMCLTFMLDPQYEHEIKQDGVNREIISRCVLYHIPTSNRVASGEGSCSTYESKYQYRKVEPECPRCHKMLRRSKNNGEWYCWTKMGGCGATFPLSDARIKSGGRVVNPDIPDQYNTVLKMANKRSLVAAILNATAASEIFTQDVEDNQDEDNNFDVGEADQSQAGTANRGAGSPRAVGSPDAQTASPTTPSGASKASAAPASPATSRLAGTPPSTSQGRGDTRVVSDSASTSGAMADRQDASRAPSTEGRVGSAGSVQASRPVSDSPSVMTQGQGRHLIKLLRDSRLWNGDDPSSARKWLADEVGVEIVAIEGKTDEENCINQIRRIGGGVPFNEAVKKLNKLIAEAREA